MKELLFDVLFMSDIRKDLLLLLRDGPRDLESIMGSMSIERQPLKLQLRILEDEFLVTKVKGPEDSYRLTTIGRLLVEEMEPLLSTFEVLDANDGYLEHHRLDFLPRNLLERLQELGSSTVIEPSFSEIYDFNKIFREKSRVSKSYFSITTCLPPMFFSLFSEMLRQGVDIYLVLSRELFEKIKSEQYSDLKYLVENEHVHFYLYQKDMHFLSFTENDFCVQFMLLTNENYFDNKRFMSCNPDALQWGKDFFEYFRQDSMQITEV